ncbi:MAG: exo-alpha-sialidase [Clostridia bacterium]|nr:exo-alpha-sialidase [Clostridia bacterium]
MRATSQWNQTPFTRLHEYEKKLLPYVCAIVPFEYGFRFEWFDKGSSGSHKVVVHKLESYDAPMEFEVNDSICEIKDLQKDCDYEFTLYRSDMTAKSATRLVRTGFIRGNVINYLHPKDGFYAHSGKYLGSPSIVRLPSGKLFCIMDIHSGGEGENIAILFTSDDDAKSWRYVTELSPCFWPKLFYHREKLYVLACAGVYGDIVIGCSEDEGKSWSAPVRIVHGVRGDYGGHHSPVPVIENNGRLYTGFEYGAWKFEKFYHSLLSIDSDADLMKAENWVFTPPHAVNKDWEGMPLSSVTTAIEGNAVALPDGDVALILRLDPLHMPKIQYNRALMVRSKRNDPEAPLEFDRVINMPCGIRNKFVIYKDPSSDWYVAMCNEYTEDYYGRGILTLAVSKDCINWKTVLRIADAREDRKLGLHAVGYSYPDFVFDGEDIIVIARTASDGASSQHDNNIINTFRIQNYKQYLM